MKKFAVKFKQALKQALKQKENFKPSYYTWSIYLNQIPPYFFIK